MNVDSEEEEFEFMVDALGVNEIDLTLDDFDDTITKKKTDGGDAIPDSASGDGGKCSWPGCLVKTNTPPMIQCRKCSQFNLHHMCQAQWYHKHGIGEDGCTKCCFQCCKHVKKPHHITPHASVPSPPTTTCLSGTQLSHLRQPGRGLVGRGAVQGCGGRGHSFGRRSSSSKSQTAMDSSNDESVEHQGGPLKSTGKQNKVLFDRDEDSGGDDDHEMSRQGHGSILKESKYSHRTFSRCLFNDAALSISLLDYSTPAAIQHQIDNIDYQETTPSNPNDNPTFITVGIYANDTSSSATTCIPKGLARLLSELHKLDVDAVFAQLLGQDETVTSLHSPKTILDFTSNEEYLRYRHYVQAWILNPRKQSAKLNQEEQKISWWGTYMLQSTVCPEYLVSKIFSSVRNDRVFVKIKEVQALKTENILILLNLSPDLLCCDGVASLLRHFMAESEGHLIHLGKVSSYFKDKPIPDFVLTSQRPRKFAQCSASTSPVRLADVIDKLKNSIQVEVDPVNAGRIKALILDLDHTGVLQKMFGGKCHAMEPLRGLLSEADIMSYNNKALLHVAYNLQLSVVSMRNIVSLTSTVEMELGNKSTPPYGTTTLLKEFLQVCSPVTNKPIFESIIPRRSGRTLVLRMLPSLTTRIIKP